MHPWTSAKTWTVLQNHRKGSIKKRRGPTFVNLMGRTPQDQLFFISSNLFFKTFVFYKPWISFVHFGHKIALKNAGSARIFLVIFLNILTSISHWSVFNPLSRIISNLGEHWLLHSDWLTEKFAPSSEFLSRRD